MRIEIVLDNTLDSITSFELECNPFKVGEIIHIDNNVIDSEFWNNIPNIKKSFKILKIEHFFRETFGVGMKYNNHFTSRIIVIEVDN